MVPPTGLLDEVEQVLLVTGVTPPTLDQLALATFIGEADLPAAVRLLARAVR
jgi:DNA-binding transcriptional MocR family regulator